jgi:serine/threonine-protein kinase
MKPATTCTTCGAPLGSGVLDGLCARCLARIAFAPDEENPPAEGPSSPGSPKQLGDYELLQEVARGAMGVIYQARQKSLGRTVALKMILSGHFASEEEVFRFQTEAQAAANLNHPNIVAIYEIGRADGQHYFSMQWVEGRSLAQRLEDFRLPPADAAASTDRALARRRQVFIAQLLTKVARAVHYAHQRGILHRDLKPANILLDPQGEPLVADFGLAKRVDSDSDWSRSGDILGTPLYMSPEQAAGKNKQLTIATDIYSLGAVLYHLLSGRPPFTGESSLAILRQIGEQEPKAPRRLNARVDPDLETICLKCLEKIPEHRYPSAEALADDLDRWQRGEPISARPGARWEQALKWTRRNPAITGVFCTLILLAAIAFQGVSWKLWEDERIQRWEQVRLTDIPINRACHTLQFSLAIVGTPKVADGDRVARITVHYADGAKHEIAVSFQRAAGKTVTNNTSQLVFTVPPPSSPSRVPLRLAWPNPRPEIVIKSFDFTILNGRAAPILVNVAPE